MFASLVEAYVRPFRGIPRAVWALSIGAMLNRAGTMVLPWLAIYLNEERGFALDDAGLVLALYGICGVGGSLLGGWLTDRFDPVRVQITSLVIAGLFCLPLGLAESRWSLMILVGCFSLASECLRPAVHAACSMFAEDSKRQQAFTLLRLMVNFGMAIGPVIGGFLAAQKAYALLFVLDGLTSVVAAIVLWWMLGKAHRVAARREIRVQEQLAPSLSPWHDRGFLVAMGLTLLMSSLFFQFNSTLTIYLRDAYRFRPDVIALVFMTNTVTIVLVEMHIVTWAGRFQRLKVIALGSLLLGLGMFLTLCGRTAAWAVFTVLVWTFGEMTTSSMFSAWVADRAGPTRRGAYMGVYTAVWAIAFTLAPWAGLWTYDNVSPDAVFWGTGAIGVVLFAGFMLLHRASTRLTEKTF